jgi:hypothetical protein
MPKQSLFQSTIAATNKALDKIIRGEADLHFVESGVSLFINQNNATETRKKTRAIVVANPTASILIKKKAFSTFKATNDLRWMDSTEKMLLRTTKALFAFKVAQLRSYESLTKLDKFYEETGEFNFSLLSDLILSTKYLQLPGSSNTSQILSLLGSFGVAAGMAASVDDVIKTLRRNAFSTANTKTTWIVDPDDVTPYNLPSDSAFKEFDDSGSINAPATISHTAPAELISWTIIHSCDSYIYIVEYVVPDVFLQACMNPVKSPVVKGVDALVQVP